jgi:hypothetical protein
MITKQVTYTGTVEGWSMLKSLRLDKEFETVHDEEAGIYEQVATGGLVITGTFAVAGEDMQVSAAVAPAQVAIMTLSQLLDAAAAKLSQRLGV